MARKESWDRSIDLACRSDSRREGVDMMTSGLSLCRTLGPGQRVRVHRLSQWTDLCTLAPLVAVLTICTSPSQYAVRDFKNPLTCSASSRVGTKITTLVAW